MAHTSYSSTCCIRELNQTAPLAGDTCIYIVEDLMRLHYNTHNNTWYIHGIQVSLTQFPIAAMHVTIT